MRSIELQLRHLKETKPKKAFTINAKRRLFQKIESQQSETWVLRLLKNIFKPKPLPEFQHMARLRLMAKVDQSVGNVYYLPHKLFFFLHKILFSYRKIGALTLSFLLFFFALSIPYTEAESRNEIIVNNGVVSIKSLGENWEILTGKTEIQIGDQIKTAEGASAEIYFANNSVVRLAENTHLNISHFSAYSNEQLTEKLETVLKLQEGRLWTHVLPKNVQQSFSIETKNSRISTAYGVFDVVESDNTTVRSIQHAVNVESRSSTQPVILSAGYETELSLGSKGVHPLSAQNDSWSLENQQKDAMFVTQALEKEKAEIKKLAGVLPTSPLYEVKQVVDAIHESSFTQAVKTFASSKVLSSMGNSELAAKQFQRASDEFAGLWTETKFQDDILAFIEGEKALFVQVLPGDSLFSIKPYFQELFVAYAPNPELEQRKQLAETVLSVQNLSVNSESSESVLVASLDEFSKRNSALIAQSLASEEKSELEALLSIENQHLQALQNIENNIEDNKAREKTAEIRQELVQTIQNIVNKIAPEQKNVRLANANQAEWFVEQISIMVQKVETYSTTNGRKNSIYWILNSIEDTEQNLALLYALKEAMPEDVHLPISQKILKIRQSSR